MATYDELSKYLDEYEAGPQQQQLGVNFNAPEQEETPYQKMIRENYGAPAQVQQEEPGLLGSVANYFSGQQQSAQPVANQNRGWLEDISDTAAGINATRILTEQQREADDLLRKYHNDKSLTEEQRQEIKAEYDRRKQELDKTAAEVQRAKKALQQSPNLIGNAGSHVLSAGSSLESMQEQYKYNLMGALAGAAVGSTVLPGLGTFGGAYAGWKATNVPSAILVNYRDAEAGAMEAWHEVMEKTGNKDLAEQAYWDAMKPNLAYAALATVPDVLIGKGVGKGVTRGIRKVLGQEVAEEVAEQAAKGTAGKIAKAANASELDFADKAANWVATKTGLPAFGTAAGIGARMLPEVGSEMGQEAEQGISTEAAAATALHQYDPNANPDEGGWTYQRAMDWLKSEEGKETMVDTAASTALTAGLASAVGGIGSVVSGKRGNGQFDEFGNPNVKINNAVTNNEFGDAVAIAKHDTSTNLVDRMRNLEGRIGYNASDGTNCARTIGLALAGTDYQDQINVDNFVAIAKEKGQLKDPNNYVPKPGDLAVVNNGNHIVMVSENGGTIQNGSSHNGVYESAQSPQQMFGAVQYYISTSELSSGDYGVSGNLQGVNEEQRQQEYYKNLVEQERQRRQDAIREVFGAKTHEQEQQEQAVSEAQKYQQDNASEVGPINEYYNAFTRQELDALSPEQRQNLKNSFDNYYSQKQNWSDTAAERIQVARGMYSQMLANRQRTATVNNANQTVTQPTPNSTQSAPNVTPTANTTANTTEVENPVVQQQQAQQNQDVAKNATTTTPATGQQQKAQQPVAQENNDEATPLTGYQPTNEQKTAAKSNMEQQSAEQQNIVPREVVNVAKRARMGVKSAVKAMEESNLPEELKQRAYAKADEEIAAESSQSPRQRLESLLKDDFNAKTSTLNTSEKAPLIEQVRKARDRGLQLIAEGKTADEAFNEVKGDVVKPVKLSGKRFENRVNELIAEGKTPAEAYAEASKVVYPEPKAKKEGKKNGTSQKSEKLSQPETGENRNQNGNTESEKVEQQKGQTGESGQNQNQAEVTKKTPAKRHIDGFKNEVDTAVKAMTFTQEKADELIQKYNNSLGILLNRGEITQAEADANRYAMEDSVKRGLILNDGRKLLSPKVRKWLDENPFVYDKSKSREENAAVAQALKEKFIKDTGISRTIDEKLTPEREKLQARIVEYLYNIGIQNRKRERKATLAIGYPAAGKSTVTKDLTDNKGYLLIDADEAKKLLPEFHGGALADIVHDESSALSKSMFMYAIEQGDNICYPTIGGNYDSIQKKISQLHNDKGVKDSNKNVIQPYEVTLSLVDVSADEALRRISKRFEETGRFDNPKNISKLVLQKPNGYVTIQLPNGARKDRLGPTETIPVDNEILKNYLSIKDERGVERYEWIDNSFPVDADYSEILRESGELSNGYDGRLESGSGESNRGSNRGSKGRKRSVTEKQQQANRADTEDQSGSSIFKATEVKKNADNQGTVSEASGAEQSGALPENGRGRETESVSGNENGAGETVLRANDENVRNKESDRGENAASGLPEQSADVGRTADGQDAVRRGLSASEQTYNGELEKTNKAVEDGTVSVAEAKKQAEAAADKFDKELEKAEAKATAPTTGQGDPIIVSESLRKTYEGLKGIVAKVGNKSYRLTIVKSNANNDGIMRWESTDGKAVEGADNPLRCLLYEAIKMNDNGEFLSIDEIIKNLENKKEQVGLTPNFQDALDLARKMKKENVGISTTNSAQKSTNNTKYSASVEEASNTENGQELKRSLDELITEAKKAFKGAKGFRINRNDLIFTMPNGLEMKVNIKDQILLNAEEEAKARKEHGLTDTDTPITVEGYARRLDKGSLVALSKESGRGTTFHEAFHTIWDWVLTDKEKEAMLKHFTPIAEAKGIDVEEAMADGYRDWLLARLQHKGTLFGKLFQKIKDFANAALRVLTGAENVHNIYQQIEEGKVWNRDAKGRFATEENAVNNDKKFLVTNKKITGNTRIPVIDVTNVARANTTDPAVRAAIADSLIGKTFRILGSDGIGFTQKYDEEVLPNGRIKRSKPNDHLVRGAGANEFDKGLVREERQKALAIVDEILNNAMYIEKHPDAVHGTDTRYVDLYTAVQNGDKIYPIHIQAKEKDGSAGEFVVGKAMYYQLTRKGSLPATAKQLLASANDNDPSISVAQLLQNVKDKSGKPYVVNGQLQYEPAALTSDTKYAIKYANPKDKTDYKNNPLASEVSTRQTKAKGSTEDSETQRLIADLEAVKKDPALFKKLVDALKSLPGLSTSERNTEKAANIIINRIKDNIVYLHDKVPENIRERARKWYDGGNRVAKEWKKRYGISEHASAGIIAVLSPQKDWFTNMTLAERILDCVFGHANKTWTEEMSKQADGYSEMVEQPVKESKKDKAAREKRGEPVKTEIVKVTHKSIVEGDENREALERARNKTLKQLLNAGDYEAAAIWIKCFDKAHNDRGYKVLTPEGGTGDYVKTSKGENAGAAWGDFGSIAKAISIAANPTWENISYKLGEQHKVRNFSNNIRFPESKLNATIDTHAVGVGLMQPTSGGSASVEDNFGAAGGSDIIGIAGTYPLYFEAYRRAAAEISEREGRPLSAREMQSITWEAIRNLFPADMKTTEKEQSRIAGMIDEAKARLKRNKNKEAAAKKVTAEKETGEKLVNAALEKVEDGKNISDILSGLKEQATAKKLPRLVSLVEDVEKTVENHNKDKKKSKKPLDKKKLVNGIKNKWNGQENFIQDVIEAEERIKAGADEEVAYRDITYKGKDQVRISNLFKEADKQIKNLKDPAKAKEILDKAREMVYNIATKGTGQLNEFSWESTPDDVPLTGTYDRSNVKITPFDNGAGGKDKFVVGFSIDPSKYLRKENAEILRSMIESDKEEDRTKAKSALTNALEFATDWILAEFDIRDNVRPDLSFQSKDGKLTVGYTVEISNPQQTVAVAKMFGRLFEPESVIATGTKEVLGTTGKTMSIEIPAGWGSKEISELSNKLGKITDHNGNPVVATHSTSDGQMTIVNTSKWSDDTVLEDVKNAVPELNVNGTDEFATILDKNSYEDKSKEGGQHKREDYIGRAIAQRLAVELNPAEGQGLSGNGKPVAKGNRSGDQKGNRSQNESVRRENKETEQPAETGVTEKGNKYSIRSRVNFEVAPDPANTVFKKAWDKLSAAMQAKFSKIMVDEFVPEVLKMHGETMNALKPQIGGYEGDTNTSFCVEVSPSEALAISNRLGYVLSQASMMTVSPKKFKGSEKKGAITIDTPKGWGEKEVAEFYNKLYTIKDYKGRPVVGGHSTVDGQMLIINYSGMPDKLLAKKIKKVAPEFNSELSEVYAAFPQKDNYGFAETKEGAVNGKIYDEGTNTLRRKATERLAGLLGIAEELGFSRDVSGVGRGNESNEKGTAASEAGGNRGESQGRDESSGRLEAKEAAKLYDEAAEKYPQIKDKAVSKNVKYAIRQSLDFGKVEGDILDSASGNHAKESRQEPSATANTVLHPLGEQVGGMPLYTEKGFSLTRKLIDEGYADLTGQTVNSISDLAEIAQVLRHPGYEKLHYVYVKDGKVIYHETVTAAFPATVKAQYKGESERKYEKRMRETMRRIGADTFYMLHNHPDGVITPSEADFDLTDSLKSYAEPSGVKFGGHIILDTTECNVLTGGKNESRLSIPEHAQIHYDEKADVPNILLGTKLGPTQALVDISKKLADQSKTTVFFTDTSDKVRSIIQLPEEFMQMDEGQKMRYLRWAAKHEYGTWAYIVTSDKEAYKSLLPLYRQGSGVYDILLTSNPETAKGQGQYRYSGSFGFYDFFGQESALASAHKVLGDGVNKEQVQGTQGDKGASSMPNAKYSIISAAGKVIDKADAYVNRNVRTPNENTATGRASKAFSNTQNKNKAQTWTEWLKDRFDKFYREWIDKNDAIHNIDDTIEKITGKKLAEEDKIYNMVQGARAYAQGAADTLVQGSKEAFESLKESLGRGIDPKDTAAMDRLKELKKDFKFATVKEALEPIMKKDMDRKYPDYLEKHGINNWHDAFSNYLGARRILELVRLVEDKSLQYITHDKKEFTDFIDRHPEYEKFRPQPFAKGSWRDQVQNIAKTDPSLAEKMAKDLAKEYKFPKGVTRADLEALVREAPKEFDTSAQIYYQLQRNLLTMMELGHLIPADVHDKVNQMYKEYCPLMIDYSDTAGLDTAIAQFGRGADSIANVDSMLKHVLQLGSDRGLISPLESTYKSIQALTNRAERNKVAVHFVKTVANSPELQKEGILKQAPGSSADSKNCIFTVLINGKKVAFQTTQDLYGPIVGYDMPAAGIVEGLCRSAAQTLRYGATTSPSFIIRNFIRDTIFAGVSSRNGFVPVLDSFRGMWAYLHDKELRGEFDAMGITAYNYFGSGESAVKSMEELMGEKDWQYLKSHPTELIKELIKYIPKKFAAASEVVEASTRMGEYMRARAKGKSMQEAALDARDVTLDFSRSGFYGQRVNMMVPFFNACIQGGDKMFNRMIFSKDPKVRMQTARMLGLYILLPSVALWFMHKDEPWYEELDPHIKMNNWIIGKFRIPKPQEAGIAFGSGIEAMLDKLYDKDPKAGKEWVNAMREVLVPNLIPTVGLPILEWITNYSLFRDKAIEGNRLKRLPAEMRYNNNTTELSKALGKVSGLSPVKLDNTIRGYTGTLGMMVAQIPDMYFEDERNLPSKPVTERVMVRDFFLNDMNMNRTSEEFYEMVNTAQQQHAGYGKKGHPTPAVKAVNKALRDVSKQQKEIQEITNAKNISPDRKRQMIDKKREIIKMIEKKTLQRYGSKFGV